MAHTASVLAFSGINNSNAPTLLAQVYGALVTIELLAKDHLFISERKWSGGHNIFTLLPRIDGSLSSCCMQLQGNLVRLHCTDVAGNESTVAATHYPNIRYLRHANDAPAWPNASTDQMLIDTLKDARLCLQQLKSLNIAP